jgi:cbb3-type cytochrome oxidase subunit 3
MLTDVLIATVTCTLISVAVIVHALRKETRHDR